MYNLQDFCSLESDNNFSAEYIGVSQDQNAINIIFPRGFNLSNNPSQIKSDIILLLKTFDKYILRKKSNAFINENTSLYNGIGDFFPLATALWLLNDYAQNGLYQNTTTNYVSNKNGIINWNKTLKQKTPYIFDNNLFYLDFITQKNNIDSSNIIMLIQKFIIKNCLNSLGWLFPSLSIDANSSLPYSNNVCINLLKKELKIATLDRTKQLLLKMIEFLNNASTSPTTDTLKDYKTKNFEYIWEDMLNYIFGTESPNKYYPQAIWTINSKDYLASNLRPDTILNTSQCIYVIDAKYYKFGITKDPKDLPQSADINKQLLYSEHISNISNKKTLDAFLLPYNDVKGEVFKVLGSAKIPTKSRQAKVLGILVDIKTIMQSYIYDTNKTLLKTKLIELIDNNK